MKLNPHPLGLNMPTSGTGQNNARKPYHHEPLPLLATVKDACAILRVGRTTVFGMLQAGTLERRKIGRATRVTVASLMRFVGEL